MYKGDCSCGSRYISETKFNAKLDGINIIIQVEVLNH